MNDYTAAIVVALSGVALLVFGNLAAGDGPTVFGVVVGAGFLGVAAIAAWDVATTRRDRRRTARRLVGRDRADQLTDRELERLSRRRGGPQ